ncbi:hypothetical protein BaRGS_00035202 [Batillaria attramentaria]|uniref:EGF-like domain-containing protein n=1 Tax=Batillaria attramentaria TaxID=370345 RepID=A0ABD0JFC9_9CAEN
MALIGNGGFCVWTHFAGSKVPVLENAFFSSVCFSTLLHDSPLSELADDPGFTPRRHKWKIPHPDRLSLSEATATWCARNHDNGGSIVEAADIGGSCTANSDCSVALSECTGTTGSKACTCITNTTPSGTTACNPNAGYIGGTCTGNSDCTAKDANSECNTSANPDVCACSSGYTASGLTCTKNNAVSSAAASLFLMVTTIVAARFF